MGPVLGKEILLHEEHEKLFICDKLLKELFFSKETMVYFTFLKVLSLSLEFRSKLLFFFMEKNISY